MSHELLVWAYLGPETFIPLLSVIAGAIGLALAFGKNVWTLTSAAIGCLAKFFLRK